MKKKVLIVVIVILAIILILVGGAYLYIKHKLGYMNYQPINSNDIDVNSNLYNDVKGSDSNLSKSEFDSVQNILFLGSDSRNTSDASDGRSDSIIICSINPNTKALKLISIPRDTYVNIPDHGMTKINHAYAYGGEQLTLKTINQNFGLSLDKYVTIDFSGLIDVINKVGGITLTITKGEMTVLNQYLKSSDAITGKTYVPMTEYGTVTLNGEEALAYSRDRYTDNDFGRENRQRKVIEALLNKMSKLSYNEILSLSDGFLKDVKTNITSDEYIKLIYTLFASKDQYAKNIISTQVPSTDYSQGKTINGTYYFVTDMTKAKQDFITYMYNK